VLAHDGLTPNSSYYDDAPLPTMVAATLGFHCLLFPFWDKDLIAKKTARTAGNRLEQSQRCRARSLKGYDFTAAEKV
jgi:hypothetical protein